MPLLFLIIGLVLIDTVVHGTTFALARQLSTDINGGFLKWLAAIVVIGALGYAEPLKEPSRYLLALVFLVIMLTQGTGFISMFIQQIENPGQQPTPQPAGGNANLPGVPVTTTPGGTPAASGGSSSTPTSGPLQALSTAAAIAQFLPV